MRWPPGCCAAMPRWSGLTPNFTILDTDDQLRLLKQLIVAEDIDDKKWPARALLGAHRALEGPRPDARTRCLGRAGDFADGVALRLYRQYQERLGNLNACDFGDLLLHNLTLFAGSRRCWPSISSVPLHPGGRVPGHQCRAVSLAAPAGPGPAQHLLRRRRRPVDLWLARRRGRQHPALREGLSRRPDHPAGAQLPLHPPHPRRRLRPDRP